VARYRGLRRNTRRDSRHHSVNAKPCGNLGSRRLLQDVKTIRYDTVALDHSHKTREDRRCQCRATTQPSISSFRRRYPMLRTSRSIVQRSSMHSRLRKRSLDHRQHRGATCLTSHGYQTACGNILSKSLNNSVMIRKFAPSSCLGGVRRPSLLG